jgi:hypothetical protein
MLLLTVPASRTARPLLPLLLQPLTLDLIDTVMLLLTVPASCTARPLWRQQRIA